MNLSEIHRRSIEFTKTAQVDAYQQKTEWSCSAGTLKSVLQHYGIEISEEEIVKAIGAREGRGAETTDIVEGARKLGFDASEGSFSSLEEAKKTLKQGVPIIADIQSFNYPGKGHYIVITGFKPGKGFIVMDPNTKGKTAIPNWRVLSEEKLEKIWWDRAMAPPHKLMKRWGVLVKPKSKEKTAEDRELLSGGILAAEGASLAAGSGTRARLLGYKKLYHGTADPKTVEKIKREGLKASRGGEGAASIHKKFGKHSKGKVHLTGQRNVAHIFTLPPDVLKSLNTSAASGTMTPELARRVVREAWSRRKNIVKVDVPMGMYDTEFKTDTDWGSKSSKDRASRTSKDVPSKYIHGGKG